MNNGKYEYKNNSIVEDQGVKVNIKTGEIYSPPKFISIELTSRCNLDCSICRYCHHKERGEECGDMPLELFKLAVPFIKTSEQVFLSRTGEPLLAPNLMECIRICREYPCNIAMASNGSLLNEEVSEGLIDNGLDEIEISVDGIDFFYNVRGFPVEQLVRNIKKFNEIKRKKKKNNPTITFTFVAMKDNLYELLGVIKLAASLGVKKVFVHPLVIYYPCLLEQNIYKDKEKSIKILNEAKKLAVSLGLELVRRRMSLVEDEGTRKSDKYICMEPFERFHINWRGDANVICCGDRNLFMEGAVFNLRDCSVEEIWNCKEYRQVRLELLNNKLENKCKECGLIFGSADNTVSIVDPEYIPYSLRRFSEKLWIENVDQRAVFQEKLLRRKYKAEENLKIQADILKSKIEEVAQVSEELYQARKNIVEKETVISKQEKVIKANEQKFIKKDAAITEQQNVIEEKEAYIQFIWQSKLWKFLKLVKKLVKFFSIKKNNNKVK